MKSLEGKKKIKKVRKEIEEIEKELLKLEPEEGGGDIDQYLKTGVKPKEK